jgi:hypothetical protein
MNDYQNAKHASYKLMVIEAQNYPKEVATIPAFATGMARLETINKLTEELGIQQAKDLTGITEDKNAVANTVIDYLLDVSGAVHSYAVSQKDKTLQARVNYKVTTVDRMSIPFLLKAAAIVIEEANKLTPEQLTEQGITVAEMTEFKAGYTELNAKNSDKRTAEIDRSGYTQQIADLFAEAGDLKKNVLDRLATQFQRKAPEFYHKYKAASIVIYKRKSKTSKTNEAK